MDERQITKKNTGQRKTAMCVSDDSQLGCQ